MSLTDIMSNSGLAGYASVALVLFLATFLFATLRLAQETDEEALRHASELPLESER
jgi:hypothetical protein